jgi:hypothetical protein
LLSARSQHICDWLINNESCEHDSDGALTVAQQIGGPTGNHVADAAREAFVHGASKGLLVAIIAVGLGALLALRYRPARKAEAERAPQGAIAVAAAA